MTAVAVAPAAWGAVCSITQNKNATPDFASVTVAQQEIAGVFPDPTKLGDGYTGGDLIGVGPFDIIPLVDLNAKQVGVSVSVIGIGIGTYYVAFDKGLTININLKFVKGTLTFTIHDSALWAGWEVTILGKKYSGSEHKIIGW